jgi:alpha-ketoglutarate-dependent 2,4-dichlorophenoxyacetate dioxygenase
VDQAGLPGFYFASWFAFFAPKGITDTRAAYDALTDAMKNRLDGLVAEHSTWHSTAKRGGYVPTEEERRSYPPARHKLVRRHPGSGRNALYLGA